jgi:hypothetical protein
LNPECLEDDLHVLVVHAWHVNEVLRALHAAILPNAVSAALARRGSVEVLHRVRHLLINVTLSIFSKGSLARLEELDAVGFARATAFTIAATSSTFRWQDLAPIPQTHELAERCGFMLNAHAPRS